MVAGIADEGVVAAEASAEECSRRNSSSGPHTRRGEAARRAGPKALADKPLDAARDKPPVAPGGQSGLLAEQPHTASGTRPAEQEKKKLSAISNQLSIKGTVGQTQGP